MQRLNLRFRLLPHEPKIVLRLKIDPDLSAEDPREPHGHVRRHRRAAIAQRRAHRTGVMRLGPRGSASGGAAARELEP